MARKNMYWETRANLGWAWKQARIAAAVATTTGGEGYYSAQKFLIIVPWFSHAPSCSTSSAYGWWHEILENIFHCQRRGRRRRDTRQTLTTHFCVKPMTLAAPWLSYLNYLFFTRGDRKRQAGRCRLLIESIFALQHQQQSGGWQSWVSCRMTMPPETKKVNQ